jgi:hypothetical protein
VSVTLHYDTDDNTYIQLHGRKRFLLVAPEAARYTHLHPVHHHHNGQAQAHFEMRRAADGGGGTGRSSTVLPEEEEEEGAGRRRRRQRARLLYGWEAAERRAASWEAVLGSGDILVLCVQHGHASGRSGPCLPACLLSAVCLCLSAVCLCARPLRSVATGPSGMPSCMQIISSAH